VWAIQTLPEGKLVIEERLTGEELSWMAFCDGERCALLEPARDHKRIFDGDQGPNTGGMGAFSPVPGVPAGWDRRVREEVFLPVLREMKKRGAPFKGVLYAGLMVDFAKDRFDVLEFNARFGDPETQVLLARMSDDLYLWCNAVAHGDLSALPERVGFAPDAAVTVVAAAKGYPDTPARGAVIEGGPGVAPDCFCAGVSRQGGRFVVSGGRVLATVGTGKDLAQARAEAYRKLAPVRFEGMQFRKDIGGSV
jgi:phosphoribosylamine--glycine ligase